MIKAPEDYQYVAFPIAPEDSHAFGDYVIIFTFRRERLRKQRAYLYSLSTGQTRRRYNLQILNPQGRTAEDCKRAVERLENDHLH